jgi:hypothetical protein
MPKSNFNHFLNECDHFENIGTFDKNKSKLSFEQGTKSNTHTNTNVHTNMFLNANSMQTAEKVIAAAASPSIIELNSETAFPSLLSSSISSSISSSTSASTAPKKFKNFKDAIVSAPSPKKQVKELTPLTIQPVVKRPPPPLLVKKESEAFARKVLAKNNNIDDDIDEDDDEYGEEEVKKNNKTYYDYDDGDSDY